MVKAKMEEEKMVTVNFKLEVLIENHPESIFDMAQKLEEVVEFYAGPGSTQISMRLVE